MSNPLKELINKTIIEIEKTSNYFYQQNQEQGYVELNNTLGTIINTVEKLVEIEQEDTMFEIDINRINEMLTFAMKAIEEKDTVLCSDILRYDLGNLLYEIGNNISNLKSNE